MPSAPTSIASLAGRTASLTEPTVLHLAVTRSAAARLAPVIAAMRGPQLCIDAIGRMEVWDGADAFAAPLAPAVMARAVAGALERARPDAVLVAGDDEVTVACAFAAARARVPIARLGAGRRCDDRGVEREVNRLTLDGLATRFYVDGDHEADRLRLEGVDAGAVRYVGSTLAAGAIAARERALEIAAWRRRGVREGEYVLVSLRQATDISSLTERVPTVVCDEPRDHLEFLSLLAGAGAVLTDGSGVQEETTALGVPCFTLAHTTELELTLTCGTNTLLGTDASALASVTLPVELDVFEPITLWDADAGRRVAADLHWAPWENL